MRNPLRVLICESNQLSGILLGRLLALRGHVPTIVTPAEAMVRVKEQTYDRLLIDTQLIPSMLPSTDRTTVIALTSRSQHETEDLCRAAGIDRWLAKPVLASELWTTLDDDDKS